ncbi:MAG: VCBS repeat-containing protein [Acidobacteria bacterium]|nr:VCBS repeat-containing protein [Acidobacteriota bacterium]
MPLSPFPSHAPLAVIHPRRGKVIPRFVTFSLSVLALLSLATADVFAQAFAPVLRLTDSSGSPVVGDFNGDGLPDVAASGVGVTGGAVGVYFGKGDGSFQPRVPNPAILNTVLFDAADFNGDGRVDLAAENFSSGTAGVLLGKGDGTFQPMAAEYILAGSSIIDIRVADYNHDGKADLVALTTDVVNVLFGNGDGTFQNRRTWGAGGSSTSFATGDFNGDGQMDVAVSGEKVGTATDGRVTVLLGDPTGTFLFYSSTDYTCGFGPQAVLARDLNGDGRIDLVTANGRDLTLSVLPGKGDGTFKAPTSYEVNGGPVSMASADFNGDGRADLVIIGTLNPDLLTQGPGFRVLLNRGDGTFTAQGFSMLGAAPRSVRAGDFNGDGKADLVLAYETAGVSVLPGNGDGTFGAAVSFNLGRPVGPRYAAPANLDGDNKLDLLVVDGAFSSSNMHAYLGNGDLTFRKASSFGERLGSGGGFIDPLAFGDFNGDGKLDFVISPALISQDGLGVYLGNGDGTFTAGYTGFTGYGLRTVAVGEFNGDGRPDLVMARSNVVQGSPAPRNLSVMVNVAASPVFKFATQFLSVSEKDGAVNLTVTRTGDLSGAASVNYSTSNGTATDRGDYTAALGTLRFAPGEASKTFSVFITADALAEGNETFTVSLGSPSGASLTSPTTANVTITNDATVPASPNPADDTAFFVRQHYRDFLNREPDADGLAFWTGDIEKCGADVQCREVKRVHVSAAFFLSIEFQDTGFYVYLLNQAAFNTGASLRLRSFLPDTREVGRNLVVGVPGWEQLLLSNKQAFAQEFVARPAFAAAYPASLTPAQFVEALNANTRDPLNPSASGALTQAERGGLAAQLAAAGNTLQARAEVLRAVAENAEFRRRQSNTAFVLMQYFGYLRRDPNDPPDTDYAGHQFWLDKLNQFHGDFVQAEMVKAFITSLEYRRRFGQ